MSLNMLIMGKDLLVVVIFFIVVVILFIVVVILFIVVVIFILQVLIILTILLIVVVGASVRYMGIGIKLSREEIGVTGADGRRMRSCSTTKSSSVTFVGVIRGNIGGRFDASVVDILCSLAASVIFITDCDSRRA